jgi:hypothetical protein
MSSTSPPRPPLSDSPWFWLYLFATSAIIGGAIIGPKFNQRQAQVERQFQGRSRAEQAKAGQTPDVPLSSPETVHWNLRPLLGVLSVVAGAGWLVLWYRRYRSSSAPPAAAGPP